MKRQALAAALFLSLAIAIPPAGVTAEDGPTVVDKKLKVTTLATGLALPTSIAFLGPDDMLVLEKDSGRVLRVQGDTTTTVLDLSVNNFSERGLLGIALHPDFPADPGVYLFWTCRALAAPDADPYHPEEQRCSDAGMGGLADSNDVLQVPLLGNRVDRFEWNGSTLTYDHNLEMLRAFQNDGGPEPPDQGDDATGPHGAQPARGNHNGGILAFGRDGKLYVIFGDNGRRGALQNLPCGPTSMKCPGDITPDDQFGGPMPDDAHFTGVILRLNDDGTTPADNPFFKTGAKMGGEIGTNIQRAYSYGIRNSFGMAVDPVSGDLWQQDNGEDAFDELNRVEPGQNSGWIQVAGPADRVGQFKQIETTSLFNETFPNLQQFRWGPENIADSRRDAERQLYKLPGSRYSDPEFSWMHVLAPAAIGFLDSKALGRGYDSDLFVGFSTPSPLGGPLFRLDLTHDRKGIDAHDRRLKDRVADNTAPRDMTESESLLFGENFGVVTDIETDPATGNLIIVSLSNGAIYEISRR